jgi:hypothetical protein
MGRMTNRRWALAFTLLAVIVLTSVAGFLLWGNSKAEAVESAPGSPEGLASTRISATSVSLAWKDRSRNEEGFLLYRDRALIATLAKGTTTYDDVNLRPATTYLYEVKAVNAFGESAASPCTFKTSNPPIRVRLDRVGVHDNGESGIRELLGGGTGEVQVGIVISDGKTTTQLTFPPKGAYKLKPDETMPVGSLVFETVEIGESLRVIATAYEDDGGLGEQVLYKALDIAAKRYIGNPASLALTLSGVDLSKIVAGIFGAEDDWLGTYDTQWTGGENWGVRSYADVQCMKEDGKVGLRLWFTVECPVYDYSSDSINTAAGTPNP